MKKLVTLCIFCISFLVVSQDVERENVNAKIIVEGNDIEGITIYNISSKKVAMTDKNGEFIIALASNDLLEIRGLKYQNFDVRVSEAVIESKRLSIFLIEEIYKLDEVIVDSKELTGILRVDVNNVKTFTPKRDVVYFGIKNNEMNDLSDVSGSQVENTGMNTQSQTMLVNGLNVINVVDQLLIPLFRSEVKDKNAVGVPEVPAKAIKYYFGSNFLAENFDIPEHRVEEFIRYVEEEEFDFDLLNYGHELEFLELLSKKSKTFLKTNRDTQLK
tara:strand:+ start:3509 stop:4327 length:819 start_codon:yes stop_codon:yes gene_type:complete